MSTYKAVFRCSAGCPGDHSIWQPLYHCPTCGGLLQVVHDIDALRHRSPVAWMRLFDDRYKRTAWPYGSGRLGQEGMGLPGRPRRERGVDGRRGHQHLLGGALRARARRRGPVGEDVRQLAHRILQGSRHDRAGLGGQADDRRRRAASARWPARRPATRRRRSPPMPRRPGSRRSSSCRAPRCRRRSWCSRSPTARWCWRSTPTSTAAWRSSSASPRRRASTWRTR